MDRICPLKIEDSGSGGTETDLFPTSLNPNEDYVEMRGGVFQNDTSNDEIVYIKRDSSDNIVFSDGVYSGEVTLSNLFAGHWDDETGYLRPGETGKAIRLYTEGGDHTEFADDGITSHGGFTFQAAGTHGFKRAVASSGFVEFSNTSASNYCGLKTFYGTDSASTHVTIWHDGTDGNVKSNSGVLNLSTSSTNDIELTPGGHLYIEAGDGDSEFLNKTGADAWFVFSSVGSYKHGLKLFYGADTSTHRLTLFNNGSNGYLSTAPGSGDGIIINPDSDILRVVNAIEFYGYAGDLSSPPDGTIWYDSTNDRFRCRIDGSTYTMAMR